MTCLRTSACTSCKKMLTRLYAGKKAAPFLSEDSVDSVRRSARAMPARALDTSVPTLGRRLNAPTAASTISVVSLQFDCSASSCTMNSVANETPSCIMLSMSSSVRMSENRSICAFSSSLATMCSTLSSNLLAFTARCFDRLAGGSTLGRHGSLCR